MLKLVPWFVVRNQWEVHLIEFKFWEYTRPDPQLQKAKAQHSMLMANLNRQGYREVKLHVILVGAMRTIYKGYTDKPLADSMHLDYYKIKKLTHKLNENSIRHASALIKTRYALQYKQQQSIKKIGATPIAQPPATSRATNPGRQSSTDLRNHTDETRHWTQPQKYLSKTPQAVGVTGWWCAGFCLPTTWSPLISLLLLSLFSRWNVVCLCMIHWGVQNTKQHHFHQASSVQRQEKEKTTQAVKATPHIN